MGLMISFDSFVISDGSPIYMQILRYIQRGAAAGRIADGDELPSRRVLSALLGINPNTVQKAYRMLEEAGLMESHAGAKSYMCLDAEKSPQSVPSCWKMMQKPRLTHCGSLVLQGRKPWR